VRGENLELCTPSAKSIEPEVQHRTLKRDDAILREFDGSGDPETLVLYHHLRDMSFDAFNASEYNAQMLRYYASGMSLVIVVARQTRANNYFLVCLQHKQPESNLPCEVAFQCMRQFCGISMLVKQRCFVCNKPDKRVARTPCEACVCFCSKDCEARGMSTYKKLCELIKDSNATVETEPVPLLE